MTCKKASSMDMIAIRKTTNRIQFDFYYNCPETGQRKRNRKSTGLIDSPENRMVAQQMAKKFLNSLKTRTTDLNIELKYAISSCDAYGRTYTIESQIMLQGLAKEIGCVYALYVPQARHRDGLVDICDSIDQDVLMLVCSQTIISIRVIFFRQLQIGCTSPLSTSKRILGGKSTDGLQ